MTETGHDYSFERYLAAKRTVDDRALNRGVFEAFRDETLRLQRSGTPRFLEIGCGTGAMAIRLLEWGAAQSGEYVGVDLDAGNVEAAREELRAWAAGRGLPVQEDSEQIHLRGDGLDVRFRFLELDVWRMCEQPAGWPRFDVVVAHAFLDLVNVPVFLPRLFRLCRPGTLLYFTLNFDGLTLLEPPVEPQLDEQIVELYHRSIDQGGRSGRPPGDSRTGRHLFSNLQRAGAEVVLAGSSDWVVHPRGGAYLHDEAYFLHHMIHFFEDELTGHPELDPDAFVSWLQTRHEQIDRAELVLIVHQLDFFSKVSGDDS